MTERRIMIAGFSFWLGLSMNVLSVPVQQAVADDHTHDADRFIVTLVEKDDRHPWFGKGLRGRGHEIAFAVDDISGKELTLVRGRTYVFEVRSSPAHDFYLSTSPVGRGREVLVDGVKGNYTHDGIVTFRPTSETPNIVFYQCQNHTYMGGVIYVVDHPDQKPQRMVLEDGSGEVIKEPERDPGALARAVKNKLRFAKMSVRNSSAAKRIADSDNAEAQSMLRKADGLISDAEFAASSGEIHKAEKLINDAIRTSSRSYQLVPDVKEVKRKARSDYENLLRSIDSSLLSYQSYEHFQRPGKSKEGALSVAQIETDLAEGRQLASNENYEAATALLQQTQQSLDMALVKLLDGKVIKYDLSFATPKDEYDYERRLNQEYNRFLTIVINKLNPPEHKTKIISMLSKQGDQLRQEASNSASKGDFDQAIETVQISTSRYKQAIQVTGIQLFGR